MITPILNEKKKKQWLDSVSPTFWTYKRRSHHEMSPTSTSTADLCASQMHFSKAPGEEKDQSLCPAAKEDFQTSKNQREKVRHTKKK